MGPPASDLIPSEKQPRTTQSSCQGVSSKLQSQEQKLRGNLHILYCRAHNEKFNREVFGTFGKFEIKLHRPLYFRGLHWWRSSKESSCSTGDPGLIPGGQEDPLEKGKATQSSILAWRIPWTDEPSGLQSMGSQRARYD